MPMLCNFSFFTLFIIVMLWLKLWDDVVFKTKLDYDSLNEKDRSIIEMESKKGVLMPKLKVSSFLSTKITLYIYSLENFKNQPIKKLIS